MQITPFKQLVFGFAISFIILLICFGWSFNSSNNLFENFGWIEHTYEVIENLKDTELRLVRAESNIRAFYITKDDRFFNTYKSNIDLLWKDIEKITDLTLDNPSQQKNIAVLNSLLRQRIQYFNLMKTYAEGNQEWNKNHVDRTIQINDKLKNINYKIISSERNLLKDRKYILRHNLQNSHYIIIFSGFVAFVISLLVIYFIRKDLIIRKKIEEELRQLNENKNKFFSIISHDLRGPVKGIAALSNMMITYSKNIDMEESLFILNSSAQKTLNLLENLLTWSRSQMNKIGYNPVDFVLKDLIQENVISIVNFAAEKNVDLKYHCDEKVIVYADRAMVNTVIRNLIWNSLKFTNAGGLIQIQADTGKDFTTLSITDNGIGIQTKELENIFSINSKFSRKGTANEEGTGLGLIICKEFIEKNGGKIWMTSIENKGTTVYFTLKTSRIVFSEKYTVATIKK